MQSTSAFGTSPRDCSNQASMSVAAKSAMPLIMRSRTVATTRVTSMFSTLLRVRKKSSARKTSPCSNTALTVSSKKWTAMGKLCFSSLRLTSSCWYHRSCACNGGTSSAATCLPSPFGLPGDANLFRALGRLNSLVCRSPSNRCRHLSRDSWYVTSADRNRAMDDSLVSTAALAALLEAVGSSFVSSRSRTTCRRRGCARSMPMPPPPPSMPSSGMRSAATAATISMPPTPPPPLLPGRSGSPAAANAARAASPASASATDTPLLGTPSGSLLCPSSGRRSGTFSHNSRSFFSSNFSVRFHRSISSPRRIVASLGLCRSPSLPPPPAGCRP
mmetsp:Transcript_118447/g.340122  ORF Transcript_118447/g.340122 Transcript_118447/m.340122 type:complete len:331 (+) Transcript_118447:293-1285(+)